MLRSAQQLQGQLVYLVPIINVCGQCPTKPFVLIKELVSLSPTLSVLFRNLVSSYIDSKIYPKDILSLTTYPQYMHTVTL